MTQLLVQGRAVLAVGPFSITDYDISGPDAIFPKQVVNNWQIVSADLPDDFTPGRYEWDSGLVAKPPAPGPVPTVAEYVAAVQAMLDAKAHERNYDGILSACTYATDPSPRFRAEGQACVDWRSAVWGKCYDVLAQVDAQAIPQPTVPQLLAMLPSLAWPT